MTSIFSNAKVFNDELQKFFKNKGYYPSQWGHSGKNMVLVKSNINGFFFDAIFTTNTEHGLTITQHPVQTGANISDHAFVNPIRITMKVGVSDAMAYRYENAYNNLGYTKSVSAYRALCELQASRIPLKVLTRLNSYENMLIESISVDDDVTTLHAFKATITLVQIKAAKVSTEKVSARPGTTGKPKPPSETQPKEVKDNRTILRKYEDAAKNNIV